MTACPRVAVVVPVHNNLARTLRFLESFRSVDYPDYALVIVDDGSTDGTQQALAERYPRVVRLAGRGDWWWSGATNRGVRWALERAFDYVLTINNDTLVAADFLRRLVDAARRQPRAIIGSRIDILGKPGVVWALGSEMAWAKGEIFHLRHRDEMFGNAGTELVPAEALTGCGTLVPAECYREIGFYDAVRFPQYHADAEFVLRAARYGWHAYIETRAVVFNDVANSAADRVGSWREWIFSKRSAVYWKPLLAIHLGYCPHRLRLRSLWQYYGWYFWRNDARVRKLGWLLRPLRAWWRRLEARIGGLATGPVPDRTGAGPSATQAMPVASAGEVAIDQAA